MSQIQFASRKGLVLSEIIVGLGLVLGFVLIPFLVAGATSYLYLLSFAAAALMVPPLRYALEEYYGAQPRLTLSQEGITAARLDGHTIPWLAIDAIDGTGRPHPKLILVLNREFDFLSPSRGWTQRRWERKFQKPVVVLPLELLDGEAHKIISAVEELHEAVWSENAQHNPAL